MTGLVYKSTGSWYTVKSEQGDFIECRMKGKFRIKGIKSTNPIAVGDWVDYELEETSDSVTGTIHTIHERKNYIVRKSVNLSHQMHIIASNIDRVFLLITINNPGDQIHNFTASVLNSTFYTFASANMNSTPGSATYDGLTLTERLKIESATIITYTTTLLSTLTLVFDPSFTGTIKLNGISYTAVAGVVIIPNVPIGLNTITKGSTTNLYYIKTVFTPSLGTNTILTEERLVLYPNPVSTHLSIESIDTIESISIYNIAGSLINKVSGDTRNLEVSYLSKGSYFIKIQTNKGIINRSFIKK